MKQVSSKVFFTVVWRGVCQAIRWFFGLFGYKRDGKFAKCVWGVFSISAAVIMLIAACSLVYAVGGHYYSRWHYKIYGCEDPVNCYMGHKDLSNRYGYHDHSRGDGFIYDRLTGEKVMTGLNWAVAPMTGDSLACICKDSKRGYFNVYTGNVVVEPQYRHAWIFSDGIGAVEKDGKVIFLNRGGKQPFSFTVPYIPEMNYVFHGGYCVVSGAEDNTFGLIDIKGKQILANHYTYICYNEGAELWEISKEGYAAVFDKNMKPIIPMMKCSTSINYKSIDVTMPDNTIKEYDFQGNLIDGFCIYSFEPLDYDTEETYQTKDSYTDEDGVEHECLSKPISKTMWAKLRKYVAGHGMEGLITSDGHVVTMPKYESIKAVGADTYLCTLSGGYNVILNGKGEIVK